MDTLQHNLPQGPGIDKDSKETDLEEQHDEEYPADAVIPQESAFKSLGWLDRLLALWILLAMIIGIVLGNFAPSVGPALQKGKFVGVSIPIGGLWHSAQH